MSHVLFLAENWFNGQQFPAGIIQDNANSAANVRQAIGTSRRSPLNVIGPAAASSYFIQITMDRIRSVDTLILDRNATGIAGLRFRLFGTNNDFGDLSVLVDDPALTSDVVYGSSIDDPPHGIRTEEGAYVFHFPEVAVQGVRISFDAGATVPKLGGCYLGKSYRPTYPRLPFDDEQTWTEQGSVRRGVPDNDGRYGKTAAVSMLMRDEQEWQHARYALRENFGRGQVMWFVGIAGNAERAWLAYNESGNISAPYSERPQSRSMVLELSEYDPVLP